MRLVVELMVAFLAAFGMSCSRPLLARLFRDDWYPISKRVMGTFLLYPVFEVVYNDLQMREGLKRRFAAFFLGAGAVGAGTVAGRVVVKE